MPYHMGSSLNLKNDASYDDAEFPQINPRMEANVRSAILAEGQETVHQRVIRILIITWY
jgi:hypothetical protein